MSLATYSPPLVEPPTAALPPIPHDKPPRKSLPQMSSRLRPPRPSILPTPQSASTPEIPTRKDSAEQVKSQQKTVRKTLSVSAFPQPPISNSRPNSQSSSKNRISDGSGCASPISQSKNRRLPRSSLASTNSDRSSKRISSGDAKPLPMGAGSRISDAQSSIHSPPHSRSSSANGSYSTSATTFEEDKEDMRGRVQDDMLLAADQRASVKPKEMKGNVIVSVRVRPDAAPPSSAQNDGEWLIDGRRSLVSYRGKEGGDYTYDNVFGAHDDNAKVYDSGAKRLVRRVMEGYHGTIFAYGMTGTGKTYSMQGTMLSPGIIPLAITDIFSYIRETPHREFLLRVSYLEIYNEKIYDLLAAPTAGGAGFGGQEEIKLREDPKRGVYATPLKEEIVQSPTQLLRVIHRGDAARRTAGTQFNSRSSRSHAVVQIVIESRERASPSGTAPEPKRVAMLPTGVRVSTLSLIDLAGSERAADDKDRRAEGGHINKSLLTLGTVIAKLSGKKDKNGNPMDSDGKHLPYRDSKLTRLLQPALSGNSLISILCTLQLSSSASVVSGSNHTVETLNTLKFAARAKNNIVSHAKKATEELTDGPNAALLERYRSEIQNLRGQLDSQQKSADDKEEKQLEKEAEQRHEEQMLEMQLARTALKERIEHLNRLILCSKSTGVNSGSMSALGMHPRLSNGTDYGASRSVRSSASQSTLGIAMPSMNRQSSFTSLGAGGAGRASYSAIADDEEDLEGDLGDGRATLQAQNRALQADLQDKNRYIATLERRLLQARRTSHSRVSAGLNKPILEEDSQRQLEEKDVIISDLQRTVEALRSALRKREVAELIPEAPPAELPMKKLLDHQKSSSNSSSLTSSASARTNGTTPLSATTPVTPIALLSPQKATNTKRKSVDEMSKMLDEMIRDKVESGQLIQSKTGSVHIPTRSASARQHSRQESNASNAEDFPPLSDMVVANLRNNRDSTATNIERAST